MTSLTTTDVQIIGDILDADAVMSGSVEAYGINKGISVSYPEVTINLVLFDTITGRIVWNMRHTVGGPSFWTRHFGAEGMTLSDTAYKAVNESLNTLFNTDLTTVAGNNRPKKTLGYLKTSSIKQPLTEN